ncbi:MAG TPA: glycosyltransferase family 87 protein [Gaiellaceae bacterium]
MSEPSRRWPQRDTALAAGGLFLVCFALVHRWFWAHGQLVDWPVYKGYGDAIVHHGLVPYRDFAVEYPPAALLVFVVPSFFSNYLTVFEILIAACGVGLVAVVTTIRPAAAYYVALSPVLAGSLILTRFDLWPALLTTGALAALLGRRHRLGWALLGLAVAAKLWPFVLVPLALGWSAVHGRARAALAGVAAFAIAVVPFAILAPHGLFESVRGQGDRPLQIESLGASLLTTFSRPVVATSHGSQNVAGHGAVAAGFGVAQWVAIVALWVAFLRGPIDRERLLRYSAACVCAFVALGKVLSPQFLLWLVPLVPLVRGRRGLAATALLTAALVLTQVWFPWRYWRYVGQFRLAGVVLARDLALVALLGVLAWPAARRLDTDS